MAQPKTIKIGAIYPLGNLATTGGWHCKRGVEMAVEIINGKYDLNLPMAMKGFPNLGGAKIEVIFGDSKRAWPRDSSHRTRWLWVIGAYQSAVTKTASQARPGRSPLSIRIPHHPH